MASENPFALEYNSKNNRTYLKKISVCSKEIFQVPLLFANPDLRPESGLELNRQLATHSEMALPLQQLPSGPVLEARSADADGAFRILLTSPDSMFFFWNGPPARGLYSRQIPTPLSRQARMAPCSTHREAI